MKLYEVSAELRSIDHAIEAMDGELPPDLEARLDALEGEFSNKVHGVCALIREHEQKAEAYKAEASRLDGRRKHYEAAARWLKEYLQGALRVRQLERVDTGLFVVRIQRNGTPRIEWQSSDPFPQEFLRMEPTEDRKAIQEAYKAGALPAGFAVSYGTHLRIQ